MSLPWKTKETTAYLTVDEYIAEVMVDKQAWTYRIHPRQTSASLRAPVFDENDQEVTITVTGVNRDEARKLCEIVAEAASE